MKNKKQLYIFMSYLMTIIFCFNAPVILHAQSGSYLDTIYQAVEGNEEGSSSSYDDNVPAYAGEDDTNTDTGIVIETDDPNAEVTIGDNTPTETSTNTNTNTDTNTNNDEMKHINEVIADMTRIIIGMNMGVTVNTSSFIIIDLDGSGTSTNTNTNTNTNTGSNTSTNTNTGSTTTTNTSTSTSSDTGSNTSTNTSTSSDTGSNTSTSTSTSSDTGSNTSTSTSTSSDTGSNTSTNTSTSSDTGSNTSTSTSTTSDTGSNTSTSTSSDTGSNTSTNTGTDTGTEETVDDLKSKISSNYGVPCIDGSSSFTTRQLQLIDEAFAKLNSKNASAKAFLKTTAGIVRDSVPPNNIEVSTVDDESTMTGYVIDGEKIVHILDKAATLSEQDIKDLEETNGRKFSQEELVQYIEDDFTNTIIHEMTHAYQNAEKEKGNDIIEKWKERFWKSDTEIKDGGITPSSYAQTEPGEDMAECVAFYVNGGGVIYTNTEGKQVFRANDFSGSKMDIERYNWIKENIFNGAEFLDPSDSSISI